MLSAKRISILAILSSISVVQAGEPLRIEDAEPLARRSFEIETGFEWCKYPGERHFDMPVSAAYGLSNSLEISVGFGSHVYDLTAHRIDDQTYVNGIQDLTFAGKWRYFKSNTVSLGLLSSIVLPTADEAKGLSYGKTQVGFALVTTVQHSRLSFDINFGYQTAGSLLHYGVALRSAIGRKLEFVGDISAESTGGIVATAGWTVGNIYHLTEKFAVFSGLGKGFTSDGCAMNFKLGLGFLR